MPRPHKPRRCRRHDGDRVFKPRSLRMVDLAEIDLRLDELEAMRLCDVDGLNQSEAGARMGVSRGTVQRLLNSGRHKVIEALVRNRALVIVEENHHEVVHPDDGE